MSGEMEKRGEFIDALISSLLSGEPGHMALPSLVGVN